jgi:hypothetical protein
MPETAQGWLIIIGSPRYQEINVNRPENDQKINNRLCDSMFILIEPEKEIYPTYNKYGQG